MAKKNVIVFYTDQQRADSLGCMGNGLSRTPNLDALAARGVRYANHYSTNPVCMPARCAFMTGRYPQANGVIDNGIHLPERETTVAHAFSAAGYRTAAFGKLHIQTYSSYDGDTSMESIQRWMSGELRGWTGPYYGFDEVHLTSCHGEGEGGEYGLWRRENFPDLQTGADAAPEDGKHPQFGCWKSAIPVEAHHSTWVADQAIEYLKRGADEPFFLFVSFPDPHSPFTPPEPWASMFDDIEFPAPDAVPGENDAKPKPWRDAMTGTPFPTDGGARFFPEFHGEAYQQVVRHTNAMVSLIDHSVGRVLDTVAELGLGDETVCAFTGDHGDFLGEHWLLFKGQLPCRSLLHTPLIIADPEGRTGVVESAVSNVDVMPTLLSACGIEIPGTVQGVLLPGPGESPLREYAFEAGWSKSSPEYHHYAMYTDDWHISVFPYLNDGELYDLRTDPHEHTNLFNDPNHATTRQQLVEQLLYAVGKAEPQRPPVLTNW